MSTVVIGIGNRDRGDDGIGPVLAAELADRLPDATTIAHEGDLSHLPLLWSADDDVVLIDAVVGDGMQPGELRVLDPEQLTGGELLSTHGFGVPEALALADRLGRRPRSLQLVGIGAGTVEAGPMDHHLRGRVSALADEIALLATG